MIVFDKILGKLKEQPFNKYLLLPDGWDDVWKAAKAASGSTPAWMTVIGDSISQAILTSDTMVNPWYQLVRANLLTHYSLMGDCYLPSMSAAFSAQLPGTLPFTVNTPDAFSNWGLGETPYWGTDTTTVNLMTYNTPYACTDIDIFYLDNTDTSANTWKYAVDGGAAVTVTTSTNKDKIKKVSITGLANTTHSIVLGNQSRGFTFNIVAIACYKNRNAGIGFAQLSSSGIRLDTGWQASGDHPVDKIQSLQGGNNAAGTPTGLGFPTQPHLAIIELGINDMVNSVTTATYFDGLRRMCEALRMGRDGASIILLIPNVPATTAASDQTSIFTNATNWPQFMSQMYLIAREFNCAVVNIHAKWGQTPVTKAFEPSNNTHPNDAGHADIAAVLKPIL